MYERGYVRADSGRIIDKGNYAYDPTHADFAGGADPDGRKDAWRAFVDCDAEAAKRGASVRPSLGTYRIARDITLTCGWDLPEGVIIRPDNGVTVTFNGYLRGMGDRDDVHASRGRGPRHVRGVIRVASGGCVIGRHLTRSHRP